MPRIAVVEPAGLAGQELLTALDAHPSLGLDLSLLSRATEAAGILTRVGESAGIVSSLEDADLESFDLVFVCDDEALADPRVASLSQAVAVVALSSGRASRLPPAVIGSPLPDTRHISSPHPASVALTHLLEPFLGLGASRAAANIVLPVSMLREGALDELFEQARALLSFESVRDNEHFPTQMAFNLLPADEDADIVEQETLSSLSQEIALSVSCTRASVFHGVSIALHVVTGEDVDVEHLRDALEQDTLIRSAEEPDLLGPVRSAGEAFIVLGDIRSSTGAGAAEPTTRLWAVMDNLVVGGAANALGLADALLS